MGFIIGAQYNDTESNAREKSSKSKGLVNKQQPLNVVPSLGFKYDLVD